MTQIPFTGFSACTITFMKQLKADNNRDWFQTRKKVIEEDYKTPALAFSTTMTEQLHSMTGLSHTSKLFRIHRDVRFSKDKTPYNTHMHISFTPEHPMANPPCWFFGLDTEKLTLGCGIFGFEATQLQTFRSRIDGPEGDEIAAILQGLIQNGARLDEPELKRIPSGYAKDHPHEALLRRKGLAVWSDLGDVSAALDKYLITTCRTEFDNLKPVFDLLLRQDQRLRIPY